MNKNFSIYGGHNANISFQDKNGFYRIIELERVFGERYYMLFDKSADQFKKDMATCLEIAKSQWGIENDFEECAIGYNGAEHASSIKDIFNVKTIKKFHHHDSHAACSFYQSPFEESFVISFDGGGDDGVFNFYRFSKKTGIEKLNFFSKYNLGHAYMLLAYPISEIKNQKGSLPRDLALAGKLMGLVGYGEVIEEWKEPFIDFFKSSSWNTNFLAQKCKFSAGIDSNSDQTSYNIAATAQFAFEFCFFEVLNNFKVWLETNYKIKKIDNLCLSGGAALNVLLNQKLLEKHQSLFIPPNPDDGGLSLGQLFLLNQENKEQNIAFNGLPILDKPEAAIFNNDLRVQECNFNDLAKLIKNGKIIGIIDGDSEVGPRALGHRSIICDPCISGMKDILNSKVKYREWFRPFAPVCLKEDAHIYFDVVKDSNNYEYMSMAPLIREEYRQKLVSVCHADNSSRLQTVNNDNHIFSQILKNLKNITSDPPVIINTSFNVKGRPILSKISDAVSVLNDTKLDYVYFNGFLISKQHE